MRERRTEVWGESLCSGYSGLAEITEWAWGAAGDKSRRCFGGHVAKDLEPYSVARRDLHQKHDQICILEKSLWVMGCG